MQFLNPNVFYMMLLPLILLIVLVLTSKELLRQHFSPKIIEKLQVGSGMLSKNTRNVLFFAVLVLFITALARPVINKTEHNVKQKLIPIVIALDLSKSMKASDIYPNRISLAKQKLKAIIQQAKNSTIGVVLFAKDAFILSPVTEDFVSLKYIVDNIDTKLNFPNGSNIFGVLESTKFMLEDYKVKNLIILSDGGNNESYENEIEFAKKENIAVYTIALATKKGAAIPEDNGYLTDKKGNIVTVKLNDSIKKLALETQGGYIDFTLDNGDVDAILQRIDSQSQKEEFSKQNIVIYTELFYYPLGLALFFLLLALSSLPNFKKQTTTLAAVIILVQLSALKTYAYEFDFEKIQKAKQLYEKKEYKEATDKYRELGATPQSLYNLGNSLYKNKKYQEAVDTYSKVVSDNTNLEASKLHNIGNSYVKLNKLQKAKEFYEKSLKIKEDKQTRENLELVNKELEKQQKQNKKDQNSKDKEKKDKENSKKEQNKDSSKDQEKQNKEEKKNDKKQKKGQQQEQNKQDKQKQKEQNSSNKQEKKQQEKSDVAQKQKTEQLKKEQISDMEERKWMEHLQNKKTPLFIQKAPTTDKGDSDVEKPW